MLAYVRVCVRLARWEKKRVSANRNNIVGYDVIGENRLHEIAVGPKPY